MLDSVHLGLPAVMEAFQMTTKVSRVGFDWKTADEALVKLDEEVLELREAIAGRADAGAIAEEVGDLLFVAVNVARLAGVDPRARSRRPTASSAAASPRRAAPARRGAQAGRRDAPGDGPPVGRGEGEGALRGQRPGREARRAPIRSR